MKNSMVDFLKLGEETRKVLKPKKKVRNKTYRKMLRKVKRHGLF